MVSSSYLNRYRLIFTPAQSYVICVLVRELWAIAGYNHTLVNNYINKTGGPQL